MARGKPQRRPRSEEDRCRVRLDRPGGHQLRLAIPWDLWLRPPMVDCLLQLSLVWCGHRRRSEAASGHPLARPLLRRRPGPDRPPLESLAEDPFTGILSTSGTLSLHVFAACLIFQRVLEYG